MKKFIVVVISILFLSVFLMMNYLLWDKDNLLKAQQDAASQQSWLRGQNNALEDSITELEASVKKLEKEKADLNEQNNALQRQVITATGREATLRRTADTKAQNLDALKTASLPILRQLLTEWMAAVSEGRLDDSFTYFTQDIHFMDRLVNPDSYRELISTTLSGLYFRNPEEDGAEQAPVLFERVGSETQDLVVLVRTQVYVRRIAGAEVPDPFFQQGANAIQVQFLYDGINRKWYIQSIYPGN